MATVLRITQRDRNEVIILATTARRPFASAHDLMFSRITPLPNDRFGSRLCENVKSAVHKEYFSHPNLATSELMTSGFHFCRNLYPLGDMWSHHKNIVASFHTASVDTRPSVGTRSVLY